jgi:hypothetical protein
LRLLNLRRFAPWLVKVVMFKAISLSHSVSHGAKPGFPCLVGIYKRLFCPLSPGCLFVFTRC